MNTWWLASYVALWLGVLFLGFLLLGALRALGLVRWRLVQPGCSLVQPGCQCSFRRALVTRIQRGRKGTATCYSHRDLKSCLSPSPALLDSHAR